MAPRIIGAGIKSFERWNKYHQGRALSESADQGEVDAGR